MTGLLQALPVTRTGLLTVSLLMLVAATVCLAAAATRARLRRYLRLSVTGLLALALATTGLTGAGVSQAAARCCQSTFPGHGKSNGGSSNSGSSNFGGGAGGSFDDGPDFGGGAGGYFGSSGGGGNRNGNGNGQKKQGGGGTSSSSRVCTGCGARAGSRAREVPGAPLGTRAGRAPSAPSGGGKHAVNTGHSSASSSGSGGGGSGNSSKQSGGSKQSNGGKRHGSSQNHSGGGGSGAAQTQTRTSKGASTSHKHGAAAGGNGAAQTQARTAKGTSRHKHGGTPVSTNQAGSGSHARTGASKAKAGSRSRVGSGRSGSGSHAGSGYQSGSSSYVGSGGSNAAASASSTSPSSFAPSTPTTSSPSSAPPNVPGLPGWWNPDNPWDSIVQHVAPDDITPMQNLLQQVGQTQVPPVLADPSLLKRYWWVPIVIVAIWAGWKIFGPGASPSGALQPGPLTDAVEAKLRALKLNPPDQAKIVKGLQKDPAGAYIADVIAKGTYDGAPGYIDVLKQIKSNAHRASVAQTLKEAARLGATPSNVKFDQHSKKDGYDIDIEITEPDGSVSAYQLKLIDPSNIASEGTEAANQLKNANAKKKTVIIELKKGTKADYRANGWDKKIQDLRDRYKDTGFDIVFPDGSRITYPPKNASAGGTTATP